MTFTGTPDGGEWVLIFLVWVVLAAVFIGLIYLVVKRAVRSEADRRK